jgi:hypothetical protein
MRYLDLGQPFEGSKVDFIFFYCLFFVCFTCERGFGYDLNLLFMFGKRLDRPLQERRHKYYTDQEIKPEKKKKKKY